MKTPGSILFIILTVVSLFVWNPSYAESFDINGFLQGNYSVNAADENPDGGKSKRAEERAQLKLGGNHDPLHFTIKTDLFYDHIDNKANVELREGYVDAVSGGWDLRIGRQIITWGLGDLIFINDLFPKDYEAFFSGRPMENLKKGVDGAKLGVYPAFASFELVVIPFFEPNNFPEPNRFSMFDPMRMVTNRVEKEPTSNLENAEVALRAYRDIAGLDASLYYYRGFYRQPSILPDNPMTPTKLTLFYPRLNAYGASIQGRALNGVLSLEAGYYDSLKDKNGRDPMILNSQSKLLLGYQRQVWEDFTVGLQYYLEYMHDYSDYKNNQPAGFPRERKLHQLSTIRLTQFLIHQTMRLSFFAIYSPSDGDYMLNPEARYNFSDNIWAAVGGNIFGGGEKWSQFGQLDKNDNIYLQIRYEF